MRSEAFGFIGINPEDFYLMEDEDFFLLRKGFFDKVLYDEELLRKQTAIIYYSQPSFGKGTSKPSFDRVWPSRFKQDKKPTYEKQRELLKKLKEKEALEKYYGRGTKGKGRR